MTTRIERLGQWIIADEAFDAWTSGDLDRMLAARSVHTNPIDRHFLLQSIVEGTYRRRSDFRMMALCIETGLTHLGEFSAITPALRTEFKGKLPHVPSFMWLATALAEEGRLDEAIQVCESAARLGLDDGTRGGYVGRAERLARKKPRNRNNTQSEVPRSMSLPSIAGPIAVFDVETTGLFPARHDRLIEVAVVIVGTNSKIEREFVSLVNPMRDIGPSSIHGLTSEDVIYAPQFSEIAALLLDALRGVVAIAGHNVRFDRQFLEAEFRRLGVAFPDCLSLCTMELGWGSNLTKCCHDFGIPIEGEAHHALADARATARLLMTLLPGHPHSARLNDLQPIYWPAVPRSNVQAVTRAASRNRQAERPTFLQRLLQRVRDQALPSASDGAAMAYGALLERVLEDRCIDGTEADALLETAIQWGLSEEQVDRAHRDYLDRLAAAAVEDSTITDAERRELELVSRLLGQEKLRIDEILNEAIAKKSCGATTSPEQVAGGSLAGKRVCFTGELQCRRDGELISRELAEELSARAGLVVVDFVTKKLDVLVVADPHTQSSKAKKARQYNIRIMHEPVFWRAIGVNVH